MPARKKKKDVPSRMRRPPQPPRHEDECRSDESSFQEDASGISSSAYPSSQKLGHQMNALVNEKLNKDKVKHIDKFEIQANEQTQRLKVLVEERLQNTYQDRKNAVGKLLACAELAENNKDNLLEPANKALHLLQAGIHTTTPSHQNSVSPHAQISAPPDEGDYMSETKELAAVISQLSQGVLNVYAKASKAVDDARQDIAVDTQFEEDIRRAQRMLLAGKHDCKTHIRAVMGSDENDEAWEREKKGKVKRLQRVRKRKRKSEETDKEDSRDEAVEERGWGNEDMKSWLTAREEVKDAAIALDDESIERSDDGREHNDTRTFAKRARRLLKCAKRILR